MPYVWRIAVEAPTYRAKDLNGYGAKTSGGRWNSPGRAVTYTASSIALAALETLTHIRGSKPLPFNRYLIRINIPDAIWNTREILKPLPGGWDALPAGLTSIQNGDRWLARCTASMLAVPSVIVPDEYNYLLNPLHPDARKMTAKTVRKWIYDPRLW
jgi:RES domain-containing protein